MDLFVCRQLGTFGSAVKVERKVSFTVKRCKSGLHLLAGRNARYNALGQVYCGECKYLYKQRWYWARQLAAYWTSATPSKTL